ncbi:MAG: O-antigen ligase family protein, partial [Pseudomonadota bacterium]
NEVAAMLATCLPMAYYLFKNEKRWFLRLLNFVNLFFITFGLFATVSRSGLIAFVFSAAAILRKNIKSFAAPFIVIIFAVVFMYFAKTLFLERETVTVMLSGKVHYDHSTETRLDLLRATFKVWLKNPLLGVGMGQVSKETSTHHDAHNAYLQILCETGLFGFLSAGYIAILFIKKTKQLQEKGPFFKEIASYYQIALLSWLIFLCFGHYYACPSLWLLLVYPFISENIYEFENRAAAQTL